MPPKKKGGKKANDDWEAELGESIAPASAPANNDDAAAAEEDNDEAGGGGLMAVLRKNKEKRKKKGLSEDFPEEEQAPAVPAQDLSAKAPEEAGMDDEFALPDKKGKGGAAGKNGKNAAAAKESAVDDDDNGGRMLTKAEKEKQKREREKQRKKEQVSPRFGVLCMACGLAWD